MRWTKAYYIDEDVKSVDDIRRCEEELQRSIGKGYVYLYGSVGLDDQLILDVGTFFAVIVGKRSWRSWGDDSK